MHGPKAPEEAGLCKEGAGQQRASLLVSQSQMWPSGTWLKCLPGAESLLAQGALKDCAVLPAVGDSGRSKSSGPSRSKNPVEFWTKLSFILDRSPCYELYQGHRNHFLSRVLSPRSISAFPAVS